MDPQERINLVEVPMLCNHLASLAAMLGVAVTLGRLDGQQRICGFSSIPITVLL